MRHVVTLLLLITLCLALAPTVTRAEDEPAAEADATEGWDAGRFWFAKIMTPSEAWTRLMADVRTLPYATRRAEQVERAGAYLDAWRAAASEGDVVPPEDLNALGRLQVAARRWAAAAESLHRLVGLTLAEDGVRDDAATSLAGLLVNTEAAEALGDEGVVKAKDAVEAYLDAREGDAARAVRGRLHNYLSRYYGNLGDDDAQVRHQMQTALEDPSQAAAVGRTLVRGLMGSTWSMETYPLVRSSGTALLTVLQRLAAEHLASLDESATERERSQAEAGVRALENAGRPFGLLGAEAPEWTLERAYGDVRSLADVRGKVVLLDFWATWCPWCIKSFPAIRDLLRDYADRGLVVVGVTASASSVYAARYDLDDDLQDRVEPGQRPTPVARLARGEPQPDATPPQLAEAAFREIELDTLATFIENHEMTWPVVMIDKAEPGPKYALTGWPHAVVLDRQGRIRYFKVGALLRDREEQVAHFREVLEALLAEPAEDAASAD